MKRWNHNIARGNLTKRDLGRISNKEGADELLETIKEVAEEHTGPEEEMDLEEIIGLLRHEADRYESMMIRAAEENEVILRDLGVIDPPTEIIEQEKYDCPYSECSEKADIMNQMNLHLSSEHDWDSYELQNITSEDLEVVTVEEEVEIE